MGSLGYGYASINIYSSMWTGKLNASTGTKCYYAQYCPNGTTPSCQPSVFALDLSVGLSCPRYMEEEDFYTINAQGQKLCLGLGFKYGTDTPRNCR